MPCYNEEMVGFGFSFLSFFVEYICKQESDSMRILDLIFQCWLVSEDPGTKRWLLVKQDSSWSTGNIEEIFCFLYKSCFIKLLFFFFCKQFFWVYLSRGEPSWCFSTDIWHFPFVFRGPFWLQFQVMSFYYTSSEAGVQL